MGIRAIASFVEQSYGLPGGLWNWDDIVRAGSIHAPEAGLGLHKELLHADMYALWGRWLLEAFVDPETESPSRLSSYAQVLQTVLVRGRSLDPHAPEDEFNGSSFRIAKRVHAELTARARARRRSISVSERETLLEVFDGAPRCWICGVLFDPAACTRFLGGTASEVESVSARYVDFVAPRGVRRAELEIQIDHVRPVAAGGGDELDNLRLACGWCNGAKNDGYSIYDVGTWTRCFEHPTLGTVSVPHPFWVVRLLAVRRRCEHRDCTVRADERALTVAPRWAGSAMTPLSMQVTCHAHDPLRESRLVPVTLFVRARVHSDRSGSVATDR